MTTRNGIWMKRIGWASVAFLAFFLFGCGTALDRTPAMKQAAQAVSAQAIAAGNVENGRKLFMGYAHFQNDGPPCMGCHNVGSNGLLGGGAMGPDLTNVSTRRTESEIASILSNSGPTLSPVMQPIFTAHPLTASEQADLIAFLNASVGQPEVNKEWMVYAISLGGFAAAVFAIGFVFRGRLRGVRKALVNKARKESL